MNQEQNIYVLMGATIVAGVMGATFTTHNAIQILGFCAVVFSQLYTQLGVIRAAKAAAEKVQEVKVAAQEVKVTAEVTAEKVSEVKDTLKKNTQVSDAKLDHIAEDVALTKAVAAEGVRVGKEAAEVGHAIHTLTNSAMGVQLREGADYKRRWAEHTKNPIDIACAEEAERLLKEHIAKQASVDSRQAASTLTIDVANEVKSIIQKSEDVTAIGEEITDHAKKITDRERDRLI